MVKIKGREEYPIYFGATPKILGIAYDLRNGMTEAEKILWSRLRNRQLKGFKFRRQHPVNEFIVDFFCYEVRLVIELDGSVHDVTTQFERDKERTKILQNMGLTEIRFRNEEVINNIEDVLTRIAEKLT